jgi:hypothetical protein
MISLCAFVFSFRLVLAVMGLSLPSICDVKVDLLTRSYQYQYCDFVVSVIFFIIQRSLFMKMVLFSCDSTVNRTRKSIIYHQAC